MSVTESNLLEVQDLHTHFFTDEGVVKAVDGVSFTIRAGETLGLVGESGCGKSVTGLSLMRLVGHPGRIVGGKIQFRGTDLLTLREPEMRRQRGAALGMIFQEPMTSLDPLYRARDPLEEVLSIHTGADRYAARAKAIELFRAVGIADPERRIDSYPHELSGGMRQRVMMASAIACRPAILIADEPTTALDVTVQAQILALLRAIQAENEMAVLLITHNLAVVAENCDHVAVMYAGRIVEEAPVDLLFSNPRHPYTQGLLKAVPRLDHPPRQPLPAIPGAVPHPLHLPTGCRFRDRCPWAEDRCAEQEPDLLDVEPGHRAACWVMPGY